MHADTHVHKWYMVKLDKVNLLVHLVQSFHIKPRKFTTEGLKPDSSNIHV